MATDADTYPVAIVTPLLSFITLHPVVDADVYPEVLLFMEDGVADIPSGKEAPFIASGRSAMTRDLNVAGPLLPLGAASTLLAVLLEFVL